MTRRPQRWRHSWLWLGVLIVLTVGLWQFRFVAVPHRINGAAGFSKELAGWEVRGGERGFSVIDGKATARFSVTPDNGEFTQALYWLGSVEELRFLKLRTEMEWSDIVPGPQYWAKPRIVLIERTPDGGLRYPRDHPAFLAEGTKSWHTEESVYELTSKLHQVGFAVQMLGKSGTLQIRSIDITALRQRTWFPAATALLLAGWILWIVRWIHPVHVSMTRRLAASFLLVGASWFLLLPGARTQFKPLVGDFSTGTPAPLQSSAFTQLMKPLEAPRQSEPSRPSVGEPPHVPPPSSPSTSDSKPPHHAAPTPEQRRTPLLIGLLRKADLKVRSIHVISFTALSLASFLLLHGLHSRNLLASLAVLSELVSGWLNRNFDWGDLIDFFGNFLGILIAVFLFEAIRRWRERSAHAPNPASS